MTILHRSNFHLVTPSFSSVKVNNFSTSSILSADNDNNLDTSKEFTEVAEANRELARLSSNMMLTHLAKNNMLNNVALEKRPEVIPAVQEAHRNMMNRYVSLDREIDSLDHDDTSSYAKETDLDLEKHLIREAFQSFSESMVPLDLLTDRQRESYRKLQEDAASDLASYQAQCQVYKDKVASYFEGNESEYDSSDSSETSDTSDTSDTSGAPVPTDTSGTPRPRDTSETPVPRDREQNNGSLLDDYADPSQDMPSYMDPED